MGSVELGHTSVAETVLVPCSALCKLINIARISCSNFAETKFALAVWRRVLIISLSSFFVGLAEQGIFLLRSPFVLDWS